MSRVNARYKYNGMYQMLPTTLFIYLMYVLVLAVDTLVYIYLPENVSQFLYLLHDVFGQNPALLRKRRKDSIKKQNDMDIFITKIPKYTF